MAPGIPAPGAPSASPGSPAPRTPHRRRKPPAAPGAAPDVTCQVCFERLPRITQEHLRTHNLTASAYARIYTPALSPSSPSIPPSSRRSRRSSAPTGPDGSPALPALLDPAARHRLAVHLASDPDFIFRLADEVSDVLATGPVRDRVRMATGAVLDARVRMHGEALSILARAYGRLSEPWRLEALESGGPVPLDGLLRVVQTLGAEVARGEDLVLRAGRLVLEEQRTRIAAGLSTVDAASRFKGGDDNAPQVPADATPEARENMRIIISQVAEWLGSPGGGPIGGAGRVLAADARVVDAVPPTSPTAPDTPASAALENGAETSAPVPAPRSRGESAALDV